MIFRPVVLDHNHTITLHLQGTVYLVKVSGQGLGSVEMETN